MFLPQRASRYRDFNTEIKRVFGEKVHRVTIDAGFTCPNVDGTKAKGGCTFCEDTSYTGNSYKRGTDVSGQIARGIDYASRRYKGKKFFAYFQNGTNTYAPIPILREMHESALFFKNIVGLFIATRPDCLNEETLHYLSELNEKTYLVMELGLQSHRNEILKKINRAHTVEDFIEGADNLNAKKIKTVAHVMLGLPGSEETDAVNLANFLNPLPLSGVKIHNVVIFRGTLLEKQYRAGLYHPLSLQEYAKQCGDFLEQLRPDIIVHRLNAHGPRPMTVAPQWSINKWATINAIHKELEKRNTWQGKNLGAPLDNLVRDMPISLLRGVAQPG